jgi:hypothetical protein
MSLLRDILLLLGAVSIVGSIATQSLWIAGVVFGCLLAGASIWWSRAINRANLTEEEKHKRRGIQ